MQKNLSQWVTKETNLSLQIQMIFFQGWGVHDKKGNRDMPSNLLRYAKVKRISIPECYRQTYNEGPNAKMPPKILFGPGTFCSINACSKANVKPLI